MEEDQRIEPPVVLIGAKPQLFVADVVASCDFYVDKLGFEIGFIYGQPPFYGQVVRDGARINLRCVSVPLIDPALRDRDSLLSAAMTVKTAEEIAALYIEFQSKGLAFAQVLQQQPWGARDFIVKDLDGNLLLFAGPAS